MALKYKICNSEGEVPQYVCDACAKAESGSVRGVAYIHKSLQSAVAGEQAKTNLGKIDWWETQINAGLVFVIPSTRGTFDGGTKKVSSATWGGKVEESLLGKTFVLNVIDRQHSGNRDFYQAFENNARSYIPAFCTERELRVATDPITAIEVKDPVEEGADSQVTWQSAITWEQNVPNTTVPIYTLTKELKELFSNCVDKQPVP